MYGDVARFFGHAGFFYSPTFQESGPGPENKELFLSRISPEEESKLRRSLPPSYLLPRFQTRAVRPEAAYGFPILAEGLADVLAAGGGGAIGSHGEMHGLGSLTVGKLADLLVLEKNPLDDIRNTTSLRWVMRGSGSMRRRASMR